MDGVRPFENLCFVVGATVEEIVAEVAVEVWMNRKIAKNVKLFYCLCNLAYLKWISD